MAESNLIKMLLLKSGMSIPALHIPAMDKIMDINEDLLREMEKSGVDCIFRKISFPHRRGDINWISGAKKPETGLNRIQKAITKLKEQNIHPF